MKDYYCVGYDKEYNMIKMVDETEEDYLYSLADFKKYNNKVFINTKLNYMCFLMGEKMKYDDMIEHILGNSIAYIEEYKKKEKLDDEEKGILLGLWMDLDSIVNQLIIENISTKHDLKFIMDELEELRNK